jgi:CheY-like chemotaxis protein
MNVPLVLLVDDDHETLDYMQTVLEPLRVRIERAKSGTEALEKIAALSPHVVVLDLILPELSGAQVLANLRARSIDVPVILVSGAATAPTIGESIAFLPKPFAPQALRDAVQRALLNG